MDHANHILTVVQIVKQTINAMLSFFWLCITTLQDRNAILWNFFLHNYRDWKSERLFVLFVSQLDNWRFFQHSYSIHCNHFWETITLQSVNFYVKLHAAMVFSLNNINNIMVSDLTNKVTNYISMRPSIHICYTILSHFHGVVKPS